MSLMLRLLITTVLLGSGLFASSSDATIEKFLKKSFSRNRGLISLEVKIVDKIKLKELDGWSAYVVNIDALVKSKPKNRQVKQKMIWFSNGSLITQDLVNMKNGKSLQESVKPKFKPEQYKRENLIYGNVDAKHKVAIFSDPLCPFCKRFAPSAINYMKKYPEKFAIYYFHRPLEAIHPASLPLVKAAIAAELKGYKDVVLKLYDVKVSSREKNIDKILSAFNEIMKTDIKPSDLKSSAVLKRFKSDENITDKLMVGGTPTVFFDGEMDKSRQKYKKVKR